MTVLPLKMAGYDDIIAEYPELRKLVDAYNQNFRLLEVLINKGGIDQNNISNSYVEYLQKVLNIVAKEMEKWLALNGEPVFDKSGINPEFIKRFPNKIQNSGFEQHSLITPALSEGRIGKPSLWFGTGHVTTWSSWEGSVAAYLFPGEFLQQTSDAGADPGWWHNFQTRVSFQTTGHGTARIRVNRTGNGQPYLLTDNSDPNNPITGLFLDYPLPTGAVSQWRMRTFFFQPEIGAGSVALRIENIHSIEPLVVDAMQIEPDFTGKWPSFYTAGPNSLAADPLAPFNTILRDVKFYTNGLVTTYEDHSVFRWTFQADGQGRITQLNNITHGFSIPVQWNNTPLPT